jgi:hypothetical protein
MATASKTGEKPAKPVAKSPAKTTKAKATIASKPKAAKTPATPKAAAVKKAVAPATKPAAAAKAKGAANLTPEQRRFYVEIAAYYIAERRGFRGGSELEDWTQAEAEIDRLLQEGILKP